MLNVHPSLLPRWRGAAPIERAIMAGDEVTGVCVMRLTEGLDSGPVALREEVPIGCRRRLRHRCSERLAAARRSAARRRRSTGTPAERSSSPSRPSDGVTYAEKIEPPSAGSIPSNPAAVEARRIRALTPHVGAFVTLGDEDRLGPRAIRALRRAAGRRRASSRPSRGSLLLGCGERRHRDRSRPAARQAAGWTPADYLRGHGTPAAAARPLALERRRRRPGGSPTRPCGGSSRRTPGPIERSARRRPRSASRAASGPRRRPSPTAPCSGGAPPTTSSRCSAGRSVEQASIRRCSRRCASALYELLFGSGDADHAAVDQAVALAKGPRRPPPGCRARQRRAPPRRPRARGAARRARRRRSGPGSGRPLGARLARRALVGGARSGRGSLAARGRQRSRPSGRSARTASAATARRRCAALTDAGVEAGAPDPGRPPAPRESIVVAGGRRGRGRGGRRGGPRSSRSRAAPPSSPRCSRPEPGERILDLCAGPGIKSDPDRRGARGRGRRARGRRARSRPRPRAARAARPPRRRGRDRRGAATPTRTAHTPERASTPSSSTRPARASAPWPRGPTPAGAAAPETDRARWPRVRRGSSRAALEAAGARRPGRLLDLHDLARARTRRS